MKIIKINGVIGYWEADPKEIVYEIEQINEDITIEIDSVGGSVMGGFSIANAIEAHKAKGYKVNIEGGAIVASIASYIAMKGSQFTIKENTTFMIHNAWLPVSGDFNVLRKAADLSEGLSSIIAKAYTVKSKIKDKEVKDMMNAETFLFGNEITKKGFANDLKETNSGTNKSEAMALAMETLKACNNSIVVNESVSFEAVAKLLPGDFKQEVEEVENKIDTDSKLKREISLKLMER